MKIRTFNASTIAEAMQNVKDEFGPDAFILSSKENARRSALGFRDKAAAEVVAATDNEVDGGVYTAAGAPPAGLSAHSGTENPSSLPAYEDGKDHLSGPKTWLGKTRSACSSNFRMNDEFNEMRRLLYSLTRPANLPPSLFSDVVAYELYQDLVANEINDWLAYKLLDEAQRDLGSEQCSQRTLLLEQVATVAKSLIKCPTSEKGMPEKKIVAFVGPTGVGKTSAAVKLSARLALENKKNVLLVTLDSWRIGAVEQLKTYATLMGLPFRVVHNISDLQKTLEDNKQRDYILIDTAGRGQRDLEPMGELMSFLQGSSQIERHLVLSATTKSVDMQEIVDRFGVCLPDQLLFTKLDETSTFGPIFNELVRTQKPLSYFADGQRVPEDLHAVKGDQIIDIVLRTH